jgi:hypothetical protein
MLVTNQDHFTSTPSPCSWFRWFTADPLIKDSVKSSVITPSL